MLVGAGQGPVLSLKGSSPQVSHLLGWQGYMILVTGDSPGSPVIKTPGFQYRGREFDSC